MTVHHGSLMSLKKQESGASLKFTIYFAFSLIHSVKSINTGFYIYTIPQTHLLTDLNVLINSSTTSRMSFNLTNLRTINFSLVIVIINR